MARTYEQDKIDVQAAVKTILNAANGGNQNDLAEVIWDTVSREHRTIQQCFWSIMLKTQMKYADNQSDLRNEASVKLAGLVKETATKANMDYGLPLI
jgi:hypothetical protein